MGSWSIYDYLNDNFVVEFCIVDYINNFIIIVYYDNMVAINSVLEIDLMGQFIVEFLGSNFYSGIGG